MIMNDTTMNNSAVSAITPYEENLRSLCKQILKSRLFRGYYDERRYVETVGGYRDIIALHRTERELQKILLDIRNKLQKPNVWVGITNGTLPGMKLHKTALDTFVWAELEETAFGQYWFNIKSMRFRENEIILKLKMVRAVDAEDGHSANSSKLSLTPRKQLRNSPAKSLAIAPNALLDDTRKSVVSRIEGEETRPLLGDRKMGFNEVTVNHNRPDEPQVDLMDFVELVNNWGRSVKQTVYTFLSNDVNKDNIVSVLRFLGLVVVSLLSSGMVAVKFLGVFALRFMFEFSRFTHVITPILLKVIELCNKIVGGFYLLLAMMWKDTVGRPKNAKNAGAPPPLEYNRPVYKSIEYTVRPGKRPSMLEKDNQFFQGKFQ